MVTCSYKGRQYISEKEQTMWNNFDKSYKQYIEGKEARPEEYIYI